MRQSSYTIGASQNKLRLIAGDHFISLPLKVKKGDVASVLDENEVLKAGTLITKAGKAVTTVAGTELVAAKIVIGELTVAATTAGADGNSLKVEVVQGSGVSVETSAVASSGKLTITLGTDGSSVALTPKADVIAALTISGEDASKFSLSSTGTTTAVALTAETSLSGGTDFTLATTDAWGVVYQDVSFKGSMSPDADPNNATEVVPVFVHGVLYESEVEFSDDTVLGGKDVEKAALHQIIFGE